MSKHPEPTTTTAPTPPSNTQPAQQRSGDDAPIALGVTSLLIWLAMPVFGSLIGIVLAAVGLNEAKKQKGRGRGLNIAALITNICLTVLQFIAIAIVVVLMIIGAFAASESYHENNGDTAPDSSLQRENQQHT